jgi:hypothetical protein
VFLSKSAQAIENKGRGVRKKLQESLRVRKLLKHWELSREVRNWSAGEMVAFLGIAGKKGVSGAGGYFMGYCTI